MHDNWGGIPRRFTFAYETFEDEGKNEAIAVARQDFQRDTLRSLTLVVTTDD